VKQTIAILLLALHLFNLGGYQLVFSKAQHAANERFQSLLDKEEYSDNQLVEVKVPLNLPYQSNWQEFERYDGEIQFEGVHYNYVKRKIYNDTLILMCLPNPEQMKIATAKDEFFSLVNGLQHTGQHKAPTAPEKAIKSITTEFLSDTDLIIPQPEVKASVPVRVMHELLPPSAPRLTEAQPPESIS
jgi:uncharacterized protein (DUF2267 family)